MVATALGPPIGHPMGGDPYYAVQRVRVEDSRAFTPGTVVDAVFRTVGGSMATEVPKPSVPIDPSGALPLGARVLLVARLPSGGALKVPGFGDLRGDNALSLDTNAGPTVFGETWYPTQANRLSDDPSPRWRLLGSIAAAIPGMDDFHVREITEALARFQIPGHAFYGRGDDRLSKTFAGAVATDSAYHRALVDLALNRLHYLGYEGRYDRDVQLAASDPDAFPDGVPSNSLIFQEDPSNAYMWPKDYKPAPPIPDADFRAALLRAQSPTVAAYLLDGLKKPAEADVHALAARFLNFADPRTRWAMAERLAFWGGAPAPDKPVETVDDAGVRHWNSTPGLDAAVAA